jgi:site-specific DNA recombinase
MTMKRRNSAAESNDRYIAAYLRVSTEGQAINGHSLDAQYAKCTQAAQLHDWSIPTFYTDEGISGSKLPEDRPEMARLISEIKADKVQSVIVYSLDRIGRKAQHILNFVTLLEDHQVQLVIVRESLDTSTAHGKFALTILAAMAQLERDYISERTREALSAIEAKGGDKGGRVAYGYIRTEQGIIEDTAAMATVKHILALHHEGKTLRAIADELNSQSIPTPKGAKTWYASTVKIITDNREAYST